MKTSKAGPFSGDRAMNLLNEIAGHPPHERQAVLRRTFLLVKESPDLLSPDEIVAAAALVAAVLPGGHQFDLGLPSDARLIPPLRDLAGSAREAYLLAAGPWLRARTSGPAAAEAHDTIAALTQVLAHGHDGPDGLDLIWDEANDYGIEGAVPDGTPPGIEHLAHLMRVYNSAMGGGLFFALEANEPFRIRRAITALRYFAMTEAAAMLDDALLNSEDPDWDSDDIAFHDLVDGGTDLLGKAFRAKAAEAPADFARE